MSHTKVISVFLIVKLFVFVRLSDQSDVSLSVRGSARLYNVDQFCGINEFFNRRTVSLTMFISEFHFLNEYLAQICIFGLSISG